MKARSAIRWALLLALCGSTQLPAQTYTFSNQDVGNPGVDPVSPGGVTNTSGTLYVTGGGSDIWNNSDAFHYYYTTVSGNFDVKVRAINLTNTPTTGYANAWVKAELMARLDDGFGLPNGPDPFIASMTTRSNTTTVGNLATSQNEVNAQTRQKRGAGGYNPGTPPTIWQPTKITPKYPTQWLRLQRLGGIFNIYSCPDNYQTNWYLHYRADTINDPVWNDPENQGLPTGWRDTVLVGLAVTSHDNTAGRTAYGTFDQLTFATGFLASVVGRYDGFSLLGGLAGADYVTNFSVIKMDGVDIKPLTGFTNSDAGLPPISTFLQYRQPTRMVIGSAHKLDLTVQTYFGATIRSTNLDFTVPYYFVPDTNNAVDIANIDQNQPGFSVKTYQSRHYHPNTSRWAEEQLAGLHGANIAAPGTDPNGNYTWPGVLNFYNGNGGYFQTGTSGSPTNSLDINPGAVFGLVGNPDPATTAYDNYSAEFFTYLYFPTSGVYQVYVACDDVFYITASRNPYDRMGAYAMALATYQMPGFPTAYNISWLVDQPGAYPFRIMMQNGGGGHGLEMYASYPQPDGTTQYILINDDGTETGMVSPIKAYRPSASSVAGPYVKKAVPVRDSMTMLYNQPIVVDLGDGLGGRTVNPNKIVLSVDGLAKDFTVTQSGGTTHILQNVTNNLTGGNHTVLLTFEDALGTAYTNTWPVRVMSGMDSGNLAWASETNAVNAPVVPAHYGVAANQVAQPGFRIRSYQPPVEAPTDIGYAQETLQGLHGPNFADLNATNGPGFFSWTDMLDFRYSTTTGDLGQWNWDFAMDTYLGAVGGYYDITYRWDPPRKAEAVALDVGAWLVFPQAGTYFMNVNNDDSFLLFATYGTPVNKLGVPLGWFNGGRGLSGGQGGADSGGTSFQIKIPAPGAYPFRLVMNNGGTDGGLEWSIWQSLPDGTVARVPVNDPTQPTSIKAYQAYGSGTEVEAQAPYATYVNPVPWAQDITAWQPIVVTIANSPTKTLKTSSIKLTVDGSPVGVTTSSPEAGKTTILEALAAPRLGGWHTNVLIYEDSSNASYTNVWAFSVMNPQPFGIAQVPVSAKVDIAQVDTGKPGLLVKAYQTTQANPPNILWTEEQFAGLHGPSIVQDLGLTNAGWGLYGLVDTPIDFAERGAQTDQNGEFRYNQSHANTFGFVVQAAAPNHNYDSLMFGGWFVFPKAGVYMMSFNGDDRFKCSVPDSKDPFSIGGTVIGFTDGSGGNTGGGAANPNRGNVFHYSFNIPAAGAYPIRMLWYNGTGGESIEWTVYTYRPDGSVQRMLINDPKEPDNIKIYQSLTAPVGPSVAFIAPGNGAVIPNSPAFTLGQGTNNPVGQDITITLKDGGIALNPSSVELYFNGIKQPTTVNYANGVATVVRPYGDPQWWPSGGYGPLVINYKDTAGTSYSQYLEHIATPFWGVLSNAMDISKVDVTKAGYKMRIYQVDSTNATTASSFATAGTTVIPTRIHVAEQILAGMWGPNVANLTNLDAAPYWNRAGTGPTAGTANFKIGGGADAGSFTGDLPFPGIPGLGFSTVNNNKSNSFVAEIIAYVNFPSVGTYTLGVNSDDGFRLIEGTTPPSNIGTLTVNSPASLAGKKPAVQNTFLTSYCISNAVAGKLVLAQGIGYPSSTNGEACVISNPTELVGNIALIYRSPYCSYQRQVLNAAAAGAIAVVLVQNRPTTEGPFLQEPGVTPPQAIPAIEISQVLGNSLLAAMATDTVNVTIDPMDFLINPPTGLGPLGQADVGKGFSDVFCVVDVKKAGVYPLRLTYFQGGGGLGLEFFSLVNGAKVLVNDRTKGGLEAYYALSFIEPTLSGKVTGNTMTLTFTGTLQSTTNLADPNSWQDVQGATSPKDVNISSGTAFYRTRSIK